ncbi:MAG TPA: TolC family protein [Gammaproteobacteria bacterium]|jgi:outer membrane protein TolC|nr:TolC family protein [Gammaproteobacteria bacterium]
MRTILHGLAGAVTAALAAGASAETLDEAWRSALGTDMKVAAATAQAEAAAAELAAARAARYPNLTASSTTMRFSETPAFDFSGAGLPVVLPLFSGNTMTMAEARVTLPVFTGGALAANVLSATANRDSRESAATATVAAVKLGVAEAYVGVLRAQSALDVARSAAASLRAHAADVEDMRRSGAVPTNDYLAAAVSLADAEQRELSADRGLAIARAAYNRALGRPLDAAVSLDALPPSFTALPATATLAELTGSARANRAELASLDAAASAWTARAAATQSGRRPQLSVSGGYTHLDNDVLNRRDYWSLALGVRWSPFDAGRTRASTSALRHEADAATAERNDRALAIELEVTTAWQLRDAARARIGVATSAVQQAEENLRVVRDRYRNGEGTNTEALNAEALRTQSLGNLDSARYDAVLAEIRLAYAAGRL